MPKSTASTSARKSASNKPEKPEKPRKNFPLFAHGGSGQWAKKIRKQTVYFGSWREDPTGKLAEEKFDREWPYLKNGQTPPPVDLSNGLTLRMLCNIFLAEKEDKLNEGDLSPRTFKDYFRTCAMLIEAFGQDKLVEALSPDDFRQLKKKMGKTLGTVSLKNEINRVCIVFNRAFPLGEKQRSRNQEKLIDKPVIFGMGFMSPSARAIRRDKNEAGEKLFERDELLQILDALDGKPVHVQGEEKPVTRKADPVLKAMVLLGANCGFGNTDIASLPLSAVNLDKGWINFPRPKTEIRRRIPLWSETIAALTVAIQLRPKPADKADAGLCFLTKSRRDGQGRRWVRIKLKEKRANSDNGDTSESQKDDTPQYVPIDALSPEFKKLLKKLHINGRRGLGFYTLRHNFETIGGESKDQVAVDSIMGHVDSSMSANYRHRISDERLQAVTDTVRDWLLASPAK